MVRWNIAGVTYPKDASGDLQRKEWREKMTMKRANRPEHYKRKTAEYARTARARAKERLRRMESMLRHCRSVLQEVSLTADCERVQCGIRDTIRELDLVLAK